MSADSSSAPWNLPDDKLLRACRVEAYTASGPGGQHRNKSQVAIRLTYLPTRTHALATDSRSQRENKIHALRNLRHKLALEIRQEIDLLKFQPPAYFAEYPGLHINPKNPLYPGTVAIVLDVLKAAQWSIPHAAVLLGLSTTGLLRFLHEDDALWTHLRAIQQRLGLKPLRWD